MTSAKMALMLENAMPVGLQDVDDLFGDSVGLSLPGASQSRPLHQRMGELRRRGCCRAVAWSRTGTIASISADGQNLELRHLQRVPENGHWELSEPSVCPAVKGTPSIPIVHLVWAASSIPDLAVIDAVGRVTIISFSICLNHPYVQRKWDADTLNDMHAVMGSYWLTIAPSNSQPYNILYGPANKHGNGYAYESSFVHAGGPSHPTPGKSALLTVTANGLLRMVWSQNTNRFEETTIELESVNSSEDRVTHAAFASEKRYLLLAVATSSKQLRFARVDIQWGLPAQADKVNPQQARVLNPSLYEKHLATMNWLQGGTTDTPQDAFTSELTHLEVLPSLLDNTGKSTVSPMVISVRCRAATEGSYQTAQSVFDRWEVIEEKHTLHPAFEQLGNRRNSISSDMPDSLQLRQISSIVINKVMIEFHTINFGKVLVLAFADGSVEYRDRFTFEELYNTEEMTRVMHLRQAGWTFADEGPCHQVAFSPTCCSMVQMSDDGKMRWNKLHFPTADIGDSMHDARYAASIAGFTLVAAPAMYYQNNYDDLLAIVRPFTVKKRFPQDWISEIIRVVKIQVDYSEDTHHDSLVRNGSLQSCLSIMNALGFQGEFNPRSFTGKFSMLALNVRNVVVLITIASNTPLTIKEKLSPLDEPEVVDTLVGCAKWSLDLLAWLIDSLFELMRDEKFLEFLTPQHFNQVAPYLHKTNNISLHFLLSSSSRGFLSAICRRIGHLEALSVRAIEFYRRQSGDPSASAKFAPRLQQSYQRMQQVTSSGLVKVADFEKLLNQLNADIRQSYQGFLPAFVKAQQNAPQGKQIDMAIKNTRIQFELALLLSASPPPAFLQVMIKFFKQDLKAFYGMTDPAQLFFANYDILEAEDDKRSLGAKKAKGTDYVDVFKRMKISPSSEHSWRRCTRCAAVMEDVFGSRPGFTFVLGQQRKCACGGLWTLVPKTGERLLV